MAIWHRLTRRNKTPQQLLSSGDYEGALKAFLNLSPAKRNDPSSMVQIADLYKRLKQPKNALKYYVMVGEHYGERGFFNKAVAAFKKGLNLDPKNESVLMKLAELNEKVPKYMIDSSIMEKIQTLDTDKQPDPKQESIITPGGRVIEEPEPIPVADLDITLGPDELDAVDVPDDIEKPAPRREEAPTSKTEAPDLPSPEASRESGVHMAQGEPAAIEMPEGKEKAAPEDIPKEVEPVVEAPPTRESAIEPPPSLDEPIEDRLELDLTSDDMTDNSVSELELHPDEFWDQEIKFDTSITQQPEISKPKDIEAQPLPSEPAASDEKEIEAPAEGNLADLITADDVSPSNEHISTRPQVVFKKRDREDPATATEEAEPTFASFDDAIESIFTVESEPLSEKNREENRKHWPIFRTMSPDIFMDFVVALGHRTIEAGAFVVRQGEPGTEMFLITEGEVEVLVTHQGKTQQVAKLQSGDFFGEGSLLTKKNRNASIRATQETELLVLDQAQFQTLIRSHPSVLETIQTVFLARSRQNTQAV